jgi:hypothetical protein
MQVRHEKQVMKDNRMFREKQYEERRQKDYEEALAREFALAEQAREAYQRETALQLAQHLEILEKKAHIKHQKTLNMVEKTVREVIDLSLKIAEYRTLNENEDLPPKLLRQWKTLFLHEQPIYKDFELPLEQEKIAPVEEIKNAEPEVGEGITILDHYEFQDYLKGQNDWKYPPPQQENGYTIYFHKPYIFLIFVTVVMQWKFSQPRMSLWHKSSMTCYF